MKPLQNPIHEFISRGIASGRLRDREKLPTERELAASFCLSRSAVREGLTVLEAEGLVVRQLGRGTFVSLNHDSRAADPSHQVALDSSPAQLIEARLVLEPNILTAAVRNASPRDLHHVAQCHEACRNASSIEEFHQCDRNLHLAIGRMTHNALLISAIMQLDRARDNMDWDNLKCLRHRQDPGRRGAVLKEHGEIVDALLVRDADSARQAMTRHLARVRASLLGS